MAASVVLPPSPTLALLSFTCIRDTSTPCAGWYLVCAGSTTGSYTPSAEVVAALSLPPAADATDVYLALDSLYLSQAGASGPLLPALLTRAERAARRSGSYRGPPPPPGSPPLGDEHLHLVLEESSGFKLFVGDVLAALDRESLQSLGITTVINCCTASCGGTPGEWAPYPTLFSYGFLHTNDSFWSLENPSEEQNEQIQLQDPSSQWKSIMLLLSECRAAGGAALIHCHWGINRSVTTAAVFLTFCGAVQAFEEGVERIRRVRVQAGPLPQYIEWGKKYCEAGFKCV